MEAIAWRNLMIMLLCHAGIFPGNPPSPFACRLAFLLQTSPVRGDLGYGMIPLAYPWGLGEACDAFLASQTQLGSSMPHLKITSAFIKINPLKDC